MAANRKKQKTPVAVFQKDPGPWSPLLINWLFTLGVILVFGIVMLFSASYTTGYLRKGSSFYFAGKQAIFLLAGVVAMFIMSYVDHRFLRKLVWPGYFIVLALLVIPWPCRPSTAVSAGSRCLSCLCRLRNWQSLR